jgi:hypothetical protein
MIRSRLHLIAALLLAAAVQACSQFGGMGGGMRHGGGDRRSGQEGNEQRSNETARLSANDQIRLRLTDLRIALNLTREQAAPWQAYEDKVIEMFSDSGRDAGVSAGGNALNQIDRRVTAEQSRAAAMEQLSNAAKKLYSTLTDEQKRVADRMLASTVPVASLGLETPSRGGR